MNIHFQHKNVTLNDDLKQIISNRMKGMRKFFSPDVKAFIDVERTRSSNNGNDLYCVSIKLQDAQYNYFTDDYQENIRKAFDEAYGELFRMVRNERSRSRVLARRASARIKNMFRRRK
jgi:ribosome-associated translation inhibitor RaiA